MVYIKGNFKMNKSLIGIVIAYITGIILAYFLDFPYKVMFMLAIITLLLSLFFLIRKKFRFALVIFYLTVVLAGIGYSEYRVNSYSKFIAPFLNTTEEVIIRGTIKSDIDIRQDRRIFNLKCESIEDNRGFHSVKGKVQVTYVTGNFVSALDDFPFQYKDKIEIKGKMYLPPQATVPGVFDYRKYLLQQGVSALIFVRDIEKITKISHDYKFINLFTRSIISIRQKLSQIISQSLPQPQASVLSGILLGRRNDISSQMQDAFANAGVMHVLAVSGLHVGLVAVIFLLFFRKIYLPQKTAALFTIIVIFIYTFITGARPSAMRAAIMAGFALGAFVLERDKNFYNSLAIACFFILLLNPLDLFNVGFQLSFSATLAILYLTPKIQRIFNFRPRWLINVTAVTVAAQIGVFPIGAFYFNKVSLVGILSNIIVIPFVGIIVAIGFFTFFISFLGSFFVQVCGWVNGLLITGIIEIVNLFSHLPYAFVYVPTPSVLFIGSYYIVVGGLGYLLSTKIKEFGSLEKNKEGIKSNFYNRVRGNYVIGFIFVFLLIIAVWFSYSILTKTDKLSITFLDVGQGDAIFVQFPDKTNMLIDGGGTIDSNFSVGERTILPFLWHKRIIKIDRIVLTHPHYNHLNGLLDVLNCFSVGKVFTNGQKYITSEYAQFLDIIEQKHIPLEILRAPRKIALGKDIVWEVLNPSMLNEDDSDEAIDNNSIVSRLVYLCPKGYGSFSILLTADIRKEIQDKLSYQDIKSMILQIPHHARSELSQKFLLKVAPQCVIISAKKYKENVLQDLENADIYDTGVYGTIVITTDGNSLHLSNSKK